MKICVRHLGSFSVSVQKPAWRGPSQESFGLWLGQGVHGAAWSDPNAA